MSEKSEQQVIELSHKLKKIREWLEDIRSVNGAILFNTENIVQALLASQRENLARIGLELLGEEE